MNFEYYLTYFFIYAFVGWILEVSFKAMRRGVFVNSGFLNGPYCPVYGFGAVAVLYFLSLVDSSNKIVLLIASMFIASLIELITGFVLEKLFNMKWWDYSDKVLNIGGYICLEFSLIWAALCFILYEAIHPLIVQLVSQFSINFLLGFDLIFALVMFVDLLATVNMILGVNKKFREIEKSSARIRQVSDKIGERVAERSLELKERKEEFESSELGEDFDRRSERLRLELKRVFDKKSERRIIRSYPNLRARIEEKLKDL